MSETKLAAARARAAAARARLSGSVGALQQRAKPQALVHELAGSLKERGSAAVSGALDGVRKRPAATAAVAAGIALILGRRHLVALFRGDSRPASPGLPPKPAKARRGSPI